MNNQENRGHQKGILKRAGRPVVCMETEGIYRLLQFAAWYNQNHDIQYCTSGWDCMLTKFNCDMTSKSLILRKQWNINISCQMNFKMTVFWDIAPCRLLEIVRCFRSAYSFCHQSDEWVFERLWDFGQFLPDYTAQHSRRQPYSHISPKQNKINAF
jgi:hypothetical protein